MKPYDVILADPPWRFATRGQSDAITPDTHYSTMTPDEIAALPVGALAADNCALFMWVVDWHRPSVAEDIARAWGFTYRTRAWVWIKAMKSGFGYHVGRGYYTQSNPEDCLLFVRGQMPVADRSVLSLIYSAVRAHSKKPDHQYEVIERLYPDMRYVELFARRRREGWAAWGNEIESSPDVAKVLNQKTG